jgi:hypothetical protein
MDYCLTWYKLACCYQPHDTDERETERAHRDHRRKVLLVIEFSAGTYVRWMYKVLRYFE